MARTAIRFHRGQQHIIDESLLLFACLCLVAATVILYITASPLYEMKMTEAAVKASPGSGQEIPTDSFTEMVSKIQSHFYAFGVLIWVVAFAVKFSYLYFFRLLIDRQSSLVKFWEVTMVINLIGAVFNICSSFTSCPKVGDQACESLCLDLHCLCIC